MAYNPKITNWSRGTPADGLLFNAEFDNLYANDEAIVGNGGGAPPQTMKQLYDSIALKVTGPTSITASGTIPIFKDTTGKVISDSGIQASNIVQGPASLAQSGVIAIFKDTTGKVLTSLAHGAANTKLFMNAAGNGQEWGFGSKVVAYTRDMTLASGDVSYTGAGRKPRSIIALSAYISSFYVGFGEGTTSWDISLYGTNLATPTVYTPQLFALIEDTAVSKIQIASVKSLDNDGCTITWTKIGTPSAGTGNFIIMYLF